MAKYLLEDMVKTKRQLQGVKEPIKEIKKEPKKREIKKIWEEDREIDSGTNYTKSKSRYMLWIVALISIIFCFFAFSFLFSKAEIKVDPKILTTTLNENLSANKDSNSDGLSFDLVAISGEESAIAKASGEKDVKVPATGTIVLYNSFSSIPQTLAIDTRLEGSNGKIYKTQIKIVIPGISSDGKPGSVEVGIYGAEAGQEYNSAPLDFKIFGFKGTPKYSKIYARSKGEITGGFVGKVPDISDADKTATINDLKTTLQAKLFKKVIEQIPDGFVLFKDATMLNINDTNIPTTVDQDSNITITLKGTLYGFLFNEQKLTKKIAGDTIDNYDGSEVFISNIKDLVFTFNNKDNTSWADVKNIDFSLSGPAKIVWKLDVNKFTTDLLGKSKKDFSQILAQYVNVNSATLTLSPVWQRSIPNQAKDIKVIVNYPNQL